MDIRGNYKVKFILVSVSGEVGFPAAHPVLNEVGPRRAEFQVQC